MNLNFAFTIPTTHVDKTNLHTSLVCRLWKTIFFAVVMLCFNTTLFPQSAEFMMKAVAFEKLSLFITWPAISSEMDTVQEFVITVLGQNPFGNILEQVYKDKKVKDKKVKINYISDIQMLSKTDILFIPKMKLGDLLKVLDYIKGLPVLTIADTEGFAEAGCFINFYEFENKLRFEINQKGMQDAGYIIDYRLLRVSKVLNSVAE